MNLDIVLWTGGALFSLGMFAVKVGFGLGYGRSGKKIVIAVLTVYAVLFAVTAMVAEKLIGIISPLLNRGPYLHILMSIGLIAWGFYTLRDAGRMAEAGEGKEAGMQALPSSLLLIVPCPVCLTAIAFSTWSALNVFKLSPLLVGTGLGIAFVVLVLVFLALARFGKSEHPQASLGLAMIAVGLYFVASLVIPAKIEAARAVYDSFSGIGSSGNHADAAGVLLLFFIAILIGYFSKQREGKK
jgi:predicted transporter